MSRGFRDTDQLRADAQKEALKRELQKANLGLASALAEAQGREAKLRRRVAALEDALAASPEPAVSVASVFPDAVDRQDDEFAAEPAPPGVKP